MEEYTIEITNYYRIVYAEGSREIYIETDMREEEPWIDLRGTLEWNNNPGRVKVSNEEKIMIKERIERYFAAPNGRKIRILD